MRKLAIFAILCICYATTGSAQSFTNTSQLLTVSLSNIIEISFSGTQSNFGDPVSLSLSPGEEAISETQNIRVRTNKAFNVNVKSKKPFFNYSGEKLPAPKLQVESSLSLSVVNNNTGGSSGTSSPSSEFFNVSNVAKPVISGGGTGNNQNYGVKYKAKVGQDVPEGTYAVDLIYTASQE